MFRAALAALAVSAGAAGAGDFPGAIFSAPPMNRPGTYVPPNSVLNAPVLTPLGTRHGEMIFDVTPMGDSPASIRTSHPEHYVVAKRECTAWITADFLYWATRGSSAPPLVQNGPSLIPPNALPFAPVPPTETLLGGGNMLTGLRPGIRLTGGLFFDSQQEWALGYSAAWLGNRSERLAGGSDGTNIVNLPQFNTVFGVPIQTPLYVGYPGVTRGTVDASVQTSFFTGSMNLRRVAQSGTGFRMDLIGGYRYANLGDSTSVSFDVVSAATPGPTSPRLMGEQSTRVRNEFNGGEVGFQFQGRMGKVTFDWQSTVALGSTRAEVDRSFTRSFFAGPGGLSGVPIQAGGLTKHTDFAWMPQVGLKIGWEVIDHIRLTAGYDFLYWSRVRRASELFTGNDSATDVWAQGMSLGFEFRF